MAPKEQLPSVSPMNAFAKVFAPASLLLQSCGAASSLSSSVPPPHDPSPETRNKNGTTRGDPIDRDVRPAAKKLPKCSCPKCLRGPASSLICVRDSSTLADPSSSSSSVPPPPDPPYDYLLQPSAKKKPKVESVYDRNLREGLELDASYVTET